MRVRGSQYLNEIVSLTLLALMILALAAGQGRVPDEDVREFREADNGVINLEVGFRRKGE